MRRDEGIFFYFLPYLQINFILYKTAELRPRLNYGGDMPALSKFQLLTYTFQLQYRSTSTEMCSYDPVSVGKYNYGGIYRKSKKALPERVQNNKTVTQRK